MGTSPVGWGAQVASVWRYVSGYAGGRRVEEWRGDVEGFGDISEIRKRMTVRVR